MEKEKPKLGNLRVESFITSLDSSEMEQTKGGLQLSIQGKKTNYSVRWTSIDTRIEIAASKTSEGKKK